MQSVQQLGSILGVWAHPDDETFTAGGLLATAAVHGQIVVNVTATRGELGAYDETRWPLDKLAEIRTKELQAAFKELGIREQHWLNYPDGGCARADAAEPIARLQDIIAHVKPDSIITFGPDGLTGHPDHVAVSRWAVVAAGGIPVYWVVQDTEQYDRYLKELDKQFNIYFNVEQPPLKLAAACDLVVRLSAEVLEKKLAALRAMPSQYDTMFQGLQAAQLEQMFNLECFVRAPH